MRQGGGFANPDERSGISADRPRPSPRAPGRGHSGPTAGSRLGTGRGAGREPTPGGGPPLGSKDRLAPAVLHLVHGIRQRGRPSRRERLARTIVLGGSRSGAGSCRSIIETVTRNAPGGTAATIRSVGRLGLSEVGRQPQRHPAREHHRRPRQTAGGDAGLLSRCLAFERAGYGVTCRWRAQVRAVRAIVLAQGLLLLCSISFHMRTLARANTSMWAGSAAA